MNGGEQVAKSVSGKTTLLVASGLLDDGRDVSTSLKHRTAIEKKVHIISEKQFLLLIQNSVSDTAGTSSTSAPSRSASTSSVPTSSSSTSSVATAPPSRLVKGGGSSSSSSSSVSQPPVGKQQQEESQKLWVDKYKPTCLEDVIGGAESVRKLLEWLRRWNDVHIHKTAKVTRQLPRCL